MCAFVLLAAILSGAEVLANAATPESFVTGKKPLTEIHVSNDGCDVDGRGSLQAPFATISRAIQEARPGTAIRVHPGKYEGGTSIGGLSGTKSHPIWIGGTPGDDKPVIEGGIVGLHLSQVRYVVVHDLVVRNTTRNGINIDDGGKYSDPDATRFIVLSDLEISDIGGSGNQDCLKLSGVDDFWIQGSLFQRCGGRGSGSGIDLVGCHDGLVKENRLHSMSGNAIQTKGGSKRIHIHANTIVDGGLRALNIGGVTGHKYFRPPLLENETNFEASNIRVTANIIAGADVSVALVGAVDNLIANNTIVSPRKSLIRSAQERKSNARYVFSPSSRNVVINNLFYFRGSELSEHFDIGPVGDANSFVFANNLWYALDDQQRSQPNLPTPESNGMYGRDPMLVAPQSGDYRILQNSPATRRGRIVEGLTTDHAGHVFEQPPSIGAFEVDLDRTE